MRGYRSPCQSGSSRSQRSGAPRSRQISAPGDASAGQCRFCRASFVAPAEPLHLFHPSMLDSREIGADKTGKRGRYPGPAPVEVVVRSSFAMLIASSALLIGPPVSAHHSAAMFDHQKQVTLSGTVKTFQFTNPHCWIQLLVSDAGGTVEWSIEMSSPAHLIRSGWNRNTLRPGDKITVVIHPVREGSNGGSYVSATGADGKAIGAPQ
jgi:Family of unknown function (DUF6152)